MPRNLNTFPDIGAIPVVEIEKVENISTGSIPAKGAASEPDEENCLPTGGLKSPKMSQEMNPSKTQDLFRPKVWQRNLCAKYCYRLNFIGAFIFDWGGG
jgi:hypothetical protein